jgi:hypothetical protein
LLRVGAVYQDVMYTHRRQRSVPIPSVAYAALLMPTLRSPCQKALLCLLLWLNSVMNPVGILLLRMRICA